MYDYPYGDPIILLFHPGSSGVDISSKKQSHIPQKGGHWFQNLNICIDKTLDSSIYLSNRHFANHTPPQKNTQCKDNKQPTTVPDVDIV